MKSVQIRSFFWSSFSLIQTEYGDLLCKSWYSARMRENTDQKKLCIWTLFTPCYYTQVRIQEVFPLSQTNLFLWSLVPIVHLKLKEVGKLVEELVTMCLTTLVINETTNGQEVVSRTRPAIACSKLTIEPPEQDVKYVQS